jgi:hypothetical protein
MDTKLLNNETFTIFNHVSENIIGFLLIVFVFIIIYIVEHISRYNALFFSMPSPIPFTNNTSIVTPINKNKIKKKLNK